MTYVSGDSTCDDHALAPARAGRCLGWVALILLCLHAGAARAQDGPGAAFLRTATMLRDEAAREATQCAHPADTLVRILCRRQVAVGLRTDYPGFSARQPDGRLAGFEVDIARALARFLGVDLVAVPVTPANRMPKVAAGDADVLIATMGHTVQRDSQARFIRPHYYQSETVVVGRRGDDVSDWHGLAGRTACIPIGASSNAMFVRHQVSVLTFEQADALLDALAFDVCSLIVHDDTFFSAKLADPAWTARFGIKFGFARQPWGMAVARDGSGRLGDLLDALSAAWHAGPVFLDLAARHRLRTGFLAEQHARFAAVACDDGSGRPVPGCLLPPVDTSPAVDRTRFAGAVTELEAYAATHLGLSLPLEMLKDRARLSRLLAGMEFSVALIGGALLATLLFTVGFAALLCGRAGRVGRWAGGLAFVAQSTPLPLLLFFAYVVASGLFRYTGTVAMWTAIAVIGVFNGSYAGQAVHEAFEARRQATGAAPGLRTAMTLSASQIAAFLVNAAKGSPAAGMIGAPEFLNTLTDLTAYSSSRLFVYVILLVFYAGLVLGVIWLTRLLQRRLPARA